jgi:UDP-GlcNAc:undecaprenyl-phosphate GlcNAc-1-phosphate transferase
MSLAVALLVALAIGVALTPMLGYAGARWGLMDRPSDDGLKIHEEPKPLVGGIGIVFAVLVASAAAGQVVPVWPTSAVLLMLAVGVVDDLRKLPPLLRLFTQVTAGAVLAAGGSTFGVLDDLGPLAVVAAVPVLANAMNIVDGQDGLAAGLAVIAAAGMTAIVATQGEADPLALAVLGALIGFLVWNRPPAKVFLGDGGAYALGSLLVIVAIGSSRSWASLVGSALCLGVFALEAASTVIRRVMGRSSLLSGDRSHVYDLLAERSGSRERATAAMLAAAVATAALGVLVAQASVPVAIAGAAAVVALATFAVRGLWHAAIRSPR